MSFAEQEREREGQYRGDGEDAYVPALDDWLDDYRERLLSCADDLHLRCRLEEHQLHGEELRGRRRQHLDDSTILTTIDPPRSLYWTMRDVMRHDPDKRAVLAFSSSQLRDQFLELLADARTTILERGWEQRPGGRVFVLGDEIRRRTVPRMFAFLARDEDGMVDTWKQAFQYPNCKPAGK
jgi:hypothetical protein